MKLVEKKAAVALRKQGRSIRSIASKIGVSTGSVSTWCASIRLTAAQRISLEIAQRQAARRALAPFIALRKNSKLRDFESQRRLAQKDIGRVTKRDLFLFGLGLYWGEGYKRGSEEWGFTNSDPAIIRVILVWLRDWYGVDTSRIIARVTINERFSSWTGRILKTWSRETGIPLRQFGKTSYIRGYGNAKLPSRTYRGTLRIKIRNGTSLRRRVLASIAEVDRQITPNSRKTAS